MPPAPTPSALTRHRRPNWRIAAGIAAFAVVAAACSGAAGDAPGPAGSAGEAPSSSIAPTPVVDPAPTSQFVLFDGSTASFADFAGQPLVVNFWASWCPSCVAEMSSAFRPVERDLGASVAFVGMNIQDRRDLALDLLEETGVEWVNAEDPTGELYVELGGLGMPFTVFIDADGGVVERHNGPLSESQLRDEIADHLAP